jgi:hypothetical protein
MDAPFGFGANPRPADNRDYRLGLAGAPAKRPAVYMPDYSQLPVKYQGKYGTCGGHAGSALVSFLDILDLSPKFLWKQIRLIDKKAGDEGTDMRSIFKALQNVGDCREELCPDDLESDYFKYTDPSAITDAMLDDAYPHGITSYAFIDNPSMEQIKQSIYGFKAVLARVECGSGWYTDKAGNGSWLEKEVLPSRLGTFDSGHFIVLWGYDEKYVYFRNSWSAEWGRKGDGYFDASYLPHVTEIGTAIPGPSIKQQLVTLYTQLKNALTGIVAQLFQRRSAPPAAPAA